MTIAGAILIALGIGSTIYGFYLNNSMEAQLNSLFNSGNVDPGTVWIVVGIIALVIGIVLLFLGISKKTPSDLFEGTALRTSFKRENTCPHCGKKLDGSPVFCPSCGERTADLKPLKETVCPYCESILTPGSSFCPACGKRIDTEYKPVHPAPAPSPRTSVPADSTTSGWSKPTDSDL